MNRVYISQYQQIKCNFCTQWFAATSQFVNLQKYSLNCCQRCLQNFKYRLVDPTTYEIYDVVIIKTGIELTTKQSQLTKRFQSVLRMHRDSAHLNQQLCSKLKDEDLTNSDIKAEINMHTQPIKERISQTCRKFLDGLIKNWNQILSQLQKGSLEFDIHKQKIINVLSERFYNFAQDPEKLLCNQRLKNSTDRLKNISEQVKKITEDKMLARIKSFIGQFLGINLPRESTDDLQSIVCFQNKENKTPNEKRNLRNIREKLIRNTSRQAENNNQLKVSVNVSNIKSVKSMKKQNAKSSRKNLLRPYVPPLELKRQKSEKAIVTIKTPRSFLQQQTEKEKQPLPLDEYRGQVSKLLKQPVEFQSYMPLEPQKSELGTDRTYGQKCLIEYLVQLKMKTTINDNLCQLINQNLSKGNLACYLRSLQWKSNITILRFVKVRIHDAQFDTLLNWLSDKSSMQILVLTNNFLTELSVEALNAFCQRHRHLSLKQVYMGNNYIKPSRAKKSVQGLKGLNIEVYF